MMITWVFDELLWSLHIAISVAHVFLKSPEGRQDGFYSSLFSSISSLNRPCDFPWPPSFLQWKHGIVRQRSIVLQVGITSSRALFVFFFQGWDLNSGPTPWASPPALFLWWVFFEIGSHELFAQAGFELRSSWSLLPQQLRLQAWVTCAQQDHWFLKLHVSLFKVQIPWVWDGILTSAFEANTWCSCFSDHTQKNTNLENAFFLLS
jgi:hypothetical protein